MTKGGSRTPSDQMSVGKGMGSLKKDNSHIISGMQIHHNFIRGHMGIDGKTPAEASGVKVEGENKWKTIIQNASLYKENSI